MSRKIILFANGERSTIACPQCGPAHLLVVRTGRNTGHQFLGCPNWPKCDYTRSIPESWKMRVLGQKELW